MFVRRQTPAKGLRRTRTSDDAPAEGSAAQQQVRAPAAVPLSVEEATTEEEAAPVAPAALRSSSAAAQAKMRAKAWRALERKEQQQQQQQRTSEYSAEGIAALRRETLSAPRSIPPDAALLDAAEDESAVAVVSLTEEQAQQQQQQQQEEEDFIPLEPSAQPLKPLSQPQRRHRTLFGDVQRDTARPAREAAVAAAEEEGSEDPEVRRWEREQMRKAVAAERGEKMEKGNSSGAFGALDVVEIAVQTEATFAARVGQTLASLREAQQRRGDELGRIAADIADSHRAIAANRERASDARRKHAFFANLRDYIANLIDLLAEKAPKVEEIEHNLLRLESGCAETARMQEEVKVKAALAAAATEKEDASTPVDECGIGEILPSTTESAIIGQDRMEIASQAQKLFEDVEDDYNSVAAVSSRIAAWKRDYPAAYRQAFCSEMLPMLFVPLVRRELLVSWQDPLSLPALEAYPWAKAIRELHGNERNDPDACLLSLVVESTAFPRAAHSLGCFLDPFNPASNQSALGLVAALLPFASDPAGEPARKLLSSVHSVLQSATEQAALPQTLCGPISRRLFARCLQLLRSVVEWRRFLSPLALQKLAVEALVTMRFLPFLKRLSPEAAASASESIANAVAPIAAMNNAALGLFADFVDSLLRTPQATASAKRALSVLGRTAF